MYEVIYLVFIRSLCIFVDIYLLSVIRSFIVFNIKYEYNITLSKSYIFLLYVLLSVDNNFVQYLIIL